MSKGKFTSFEVEGSSTKITHRAQKRKGIEKECFCSKFKPLCENSENVSTIESPLLHQALEKLVKISYGGGGEEERSIKDLNISSVEKCYPNLDKETYSFPWLYEVKNSSESTLSLRENITTKPEEEKEKHESQYGQRIGDEAEQKTFETMLEMLKWKKEVSFIIAGYEWMQKLPKEFCEDLQNVYQKEFLEGESDLLVLLPGKGVLVIEVKSQAKNISELRKQFKKDIRFVVFSTSDIIAKKKVFFYKIASFPDCSRNEIESKICDKCSPHCITQDDLKSPETLFKWFEKLTNQLPTCNFDIQLYKGMLYRFIGPQSRIEVQLIGDVILDTHGKLETHFSYKQIMPKLIQLNKTQSEIISANPKLLWVKGAPGSGKTILAQWKIRKILEERDTNDKHVVYFIAGNRDMIFIETMKKIFQDESEKKLKITSIEDEFIKIPTSYGVQGLINVIKRLIESNDGKTYLSVIVDEFWLPENASVDPLEINVLKDKMLKNVWIVQKHSCKFNPNVVKCLGFKNVEINTVMRMSLSNVDFMNSFLKTNLEVGHNIKGLPPILYKMECICDDLQAKGKCFCTPFLIAHLLKECKRSGTFETVLPKNKDRINNLEDVAVMTETHAEVKKLLMKQNLNAIVRPALCFTGCEKKVVIVDILSTGGSGEDISDVTEAITRSAGRLILFNVSCKYGNLEMQQNKIQEIISDIYKRYENGKTTFVEVKNVVTMNETEIQILKEEIKLGVYRDEHKIQQNMASVVTGEILDVALSPLKNSVDNVSHKVENLTSNFESLAGKVEELRKENNQRLEKMERTINEVLETLKTSSTVLNSSKKQSDG